MPKAPPTIGQRDPVKADDANGTKALIRSRRYREWGQRLANSRGNMCRLCWERDRRVVKYDHKHHIKPREEAPELAMDESNIDLLCEHHHNEIHGHEQPEDPGEGVF